MRKRSLVSGVQSLSAAHHQQLRTACDCFVEYQFLKTVSHSNLHQSTSETMVFAVVETRCHDYKAISPDTRIIVKSLNFALPFMASEFLNPLGNRLITTTMARTAASQLIIEYAR